MRSSRSDALAFERVMGSRRSWRRLARRAATAHERELASLARQIASDAPPVRASMALPLRGTGPAAVVTLTLSLAGWELELGGVSAEAADDLLLSSGAAPRLTRTGRYGVFWWIEVSGDGEPLVLLGSALTLCPTGGGTDAGVPREPAPALAAGPG